MNVKETLAELVRINSVSARSNLDIIKLLAARTEVAGLCARLLPYTDEQGVKKFNMVAVAPSTTRDDEVIELALVGHTDTVPFDADWAEALALTERAGKLYGRGACDTKAFIAAALTAIEQIDLAQLKRPLALVCTADEEIGCLGAKRLADAHALRARYSIVGEPTSLQPVRAGKGYCLAEVTIGGRERHLPRGAVDQPHCSGRGQIAGAATRRVRSALHDRQCRIDQWRHGQEHHRGSLSFHVGVAARAGPGSRARH
jgi:acetylornithine deacetylase